MMSQIYSVDQDVREAEAMVKNFASYLKGRELYGSVSGGFFGFGQMPSLTVGALVMRLRRLNILKDQLTNEQWDRVNAAQHKYTDTRDEWRAHFDKKVLWEVDSRLNTIGQYFKDADGSIDQAATYKPEQLRRTIIEDLRGVIADLNLTDDDLDAKTRFVDSRLRGMAIEITDFLWDAALEPAYPQKDYWWLYRKPRPARR
jgi:hypothetical protein